MTEIKKGSFAYNQARMILIKNRLEDVHRRIIERETLCENNIEDVYGKLGIKGALSPLINNFSSILKLMEMGKENSPQIEKALLEIACDIVLILTMIHKEENNETM